jgi:hypothetical protein
VLRMDSDPAGAFTTEVGSSPYMVVHRLGSRLERGELRLELEGQ